MNNPEFMAMAQNIMKQPQFADMVNQIASSQTIAEWAFLLGEGPSGFTMTGGLSGGLVERNHGGLL